MASSSTVPTATSLTSLPHVLLITISSCTFTPTPVCIFQWCQRLAMYRTGYVIAAHHQPHSRPWQETWARLIAPLTICLCVTISLRYGYYGDYHMLLGPCSSRLLKADSVFVKQVEVRENDRKGVILYGFLQKPELSLEETWIATDFAIVRSRSRKRLSFWLNEGSRIGIGWEAQTSSLNQLEVSVFKGERKYEKLLPTNSSSKDISSTGSQGKEAKYLVEEDNAYHIGIINLSPRSIIVLLSLNVSSKVHDTSKSKSICSTKNGSCHLNLRFPNPEYIVLSTPNDGDQSKWYIEISFLARVGAYISVLGGLIIAIVLMIKYLGLCNGQFHEAEAAVTTERASETEPLVPQKVIGLPYGTDEDQGYHTSSSSEDLYDGKICVICYDNLRNCFFVPCGHCATCHDCAMRIMEGECKVCPICRRFIHKVKKLLMA